MRLVTFNILSGRSPADGRTDPERLAAAIRRLDPDVLGLQEVDQDQPRSGGTDLTAVAAEAMGAVDQRFAAVLDGTPGHRWVPLDGDPVPGHPLYGIALLSRYPVESFDLLRLPGAGPHFGVPLPAARRTVLVGEEPRAAVIARIATPGGELTVATTHLSFLPGINAMQLRRVVRRLGPVAGPAVIMGDLNLPAPLPARITGFRPLAEHRTFPTRRPRLQLDHILARGDLGSVRHSAAPALQVSDHRALLVEIG